MWLLTHAGIKVNPGYKNGPQVLGALFVIKVPTHRWQDAANENGLLPGYANAAYVCMAPNEGRILGLHPANEKRRYLVTAFLTDWMQA